MRKFIIEELEKVQDSAHNFNLEDEQALYGKPQPCIRKIDAFNVCLKVIDRMQANPVENQVIVSEQQSVSANGAVAEEYPTPRLKYNRDCCHVRDIGLFIDVNSETIDKKLLNEYGKILYKIGVELLATASL